MTLLADIKFLDGITRRCTGTIKGGIPNVSPGVGVPWKDKQEIYKHCAQNKLEVIRIIEVPATAG